MLPNTREMGTTLRTSQWNRTIAALLLGTPARPQKVILPSDFPYTRDLRRAEGEERGEEPLTSGPRPGTCCRDQEPNEEKERGWW